MSYTDLDPKAVFFQTLAAIPPGYYTSYGRIAQLCGVHVRQVQSWLRTLPSDTQLPWYRIINSQRQITEHGGSVIQHKKLMAEGLWPEKNGRFPSNRYWPDCLG